MTLKMSDEQKAIVYNAVDTVIKFLNNDPSYKPMRATIMGSAGTAKGRGERTPKGLPKSARRGMSG